MAKKVSKKAHGRGINALLRNIETDMKSAPEEVVKELSSSVAMIPIGEIEVNPWQPRNEFDPETLEELAASLRTHGLIQPLTVRRLADKQYQLISGERRMRASKLAGLEEVPAYIRIANDQEMIEMALVENIQRENLNALEVAIGYQRLIEETDVTHDNIADRVGKKRSSVTNFLRLLKLPPDIQKALQQEKISMGHAKCLLALEENLPAQLLVFEQVLKRALSVRATESLVKSYKEPRAAKPAPKELSGDYKTVQDNLRSQLGSKVSLKVKDNGSGQISIPFTSTKDLNRLLDLLEN